MELFYQNLSLSMTQTQVKAKVAPIIAYVEIIALAMAKGCYTYAMTIWSQEGGIGLLTDHNWQNLKSFKVEFPKN